MSGFCDIHTHILPHIDDGAKDWETCLEMVDRSWEGGVRRIIATPHYLPWKKKKINSFDIIRLCKEAEFRVRRELGYEIRIYPGQEIYYHIDMIKELQQGVALTLGGTRHILVEFSPDTSWQQLRQAIKHIRASQYQPVLAHIERYECLHEKENLEEARELGAMLQMNVQSLQGGMLDSTARWCKRQLLDGKIDFIASDMHNLNSRPPISYDMLGWIGKKLNRDYQKDIFIRNALKMGL